MFCAIIIMVGYLHWQEKISAQASISNVEKSESKDINSLTASGSQNVKDYTKNLPPNLKIMIEDASNKGKKIKFVIYGSETTSNNKNAWPNILKTEMNEAYGSVFEFIIISEKDKTSKEVVNENLFEKVTKENPDVLLFEPFLLKDNGEVGIINTLLNIEDMIADLKEKNEDVFVMLQPPHPLYNATFYPKEVQEFKQFALAEGYIYLDHWQSWPKQNDSELKQYLSEDNAKPNDKGNRVWADYLAQYFISR